MNDIVAPRAGRREWIGLAVLILPTLLIAMDLTVLHLAVPHLSAELQPSSSQLLWIVDIYGFLIAGSLITMGTLGDRIGRRKLLLIGAAAFGAASVFAAFSTSPEMLIVARALLGIAGATLMPSTQSLIRNMFHNPAQRTAAIGVWISGFSAGSAIGPLMGGWLLERYWWGAAFLLGVPVMLLLLVLGPFLLPEYKDPNPGKFDLLSAGQSLASVLLVIFGLKRIAESGLDALPIASIAAGLLIGTLFFRRQMILPDPLLDLRLFSNRVFSTALSANSITFFLQIGIFLFTAQYLQLVLGLSPLEAGLWTVPSAITFIIGSNVVPRVVGRIRPSSMIAAGLALAAIGAGILLLVGVSSGLEIVIASTVITSLGFSMVVTLTTDMILGAAPPARAGAAAALSETGIEFGGALGIAILGSVGTAVYRGVTGQSMPAGVPPAAAEVARDTLGGAVATAAELPAPLADTLLYVARGGFVQGFHLIAVISAVTTLILTLVTLSILRRVDHDSPEPVALPDPDSTPARDVARAA